MKKNCKKLLSIFLKNILYKTFFVINFVGNTCKFYNFIKNNYQKENTYRLRFLEKMAKKKYPF